MDYLIEEVLKTQSNDVKDFLLKTSILEQISAPLCDVVLDKKNKMGVGRRSDIRTAFQTVFNYWQFSGMPAWADKSVPIAIAISLALVLV